MAIINLKTGELEGEAPVQVSPKVVLDTPRIGNLIDLKTGELIERPPQSVQQPAPQALPPQVELPQQQAQPAPTQAAPPQSGVQTTPRRGRPGQAARLQQERDKSPFGLPDELRTRNLRPTPPETGFTDIFTGAERETRATQELPEIGRGGLLSGESGTDIAKFTPLLALTTDENELADALKTTFPHIGISFDEKGNIIATNPKNQVAVVVNKPGLSGLDLAQITGITAAFTPAARTATAAGAGLTALGATTKQALTGTALTGAATSGLTQAGIEALEQQLGGELNEEEIAIASALGGAAELVLPAIQSFRQSRRAAAIGAAGEEVPEAVEAVTKAQEAQQAIKELTGVEVGLFQPQQTLLPSELLKQRLLPQLDASSRIAAKALENQNKEIFDATSEVIESIAPGGEIAGASAKFKKAAEDALQLAKNERQAAVKPLYDEAFEEARTQGLKVDLGPVESFVNRQLKGLVKDDPATKALGRFMTRIKGQKQAGKEAGLLVDDAGNPIIRETGETIRPLTLEQLQSAKRTTDAELDRMSGVGRPNSAIKNAKRLLAQAEKLYVEQVGKMSPKFAEANAEFARLSPRVDAVQNSLIGEITKIPDDKLRNVTARLFNPTEEATSPSAISNAKKLIQRVDPDAWELIMKTELNKRFASFREVVEEAPENVANTPAGIKKAIFGNPRQRMVLMAGMDADQKKVFKHLETLLGRALAGRAPGSTTAPFGAAMQKIRGSFRVVWDTLFDLKGAIKEASFDRSAAAMARIIFDPTLKVEAQRLTQLNPNSPAAARAMTQLLNKASVEPDEDQEN